MFRKTAEITAFLGLAFITGPALMADPGDKRSAEPVQTGRGLLADRPMPPLRKTAKSASANLKAIDGYSLSPFAQRAGAITALAAHEQALFGLDPSRSRIMRFADRRGAGTSGQSSTFLSGLSHPSDLQVHDGHLYYTDSLGLWRVPIGRGLSPSAPPQRLVDLSSVNAKAAPRPFTLINDGAQALIGFSANPETSHSAPDAGRAIISVDLKSSVASIFAGGLGDVQALEAAPSGHVFAITKKPEQPSSQIHVFTPDGVQSAQMPLEPSGGPSDILLTPNASWGDMLMAFRGAAEDGRGGFHVSAISFALGVPNPEYEVIIDGFTNTSRRSAWGRPSALAAFGANSVIIADDWSETLWRLSPSPQPEEAAPSPSESEDESEAEPTDAEPEVDADEADAEEAENEEAEKPTRIRIGGRRNIRN